MTAVRFEQWRPDRSQLAQYLWAYGEIALSVRALALLAATHDRICDLTEKYVLYGIPLYRAAPLAAVVVLEGRRRDLKRRRPTGIDNREPEIDAESENIGIRLAEYSLGRSLKKREVYDGVAEILNPMLAEFQYYRSQGQYRRPFVNGTAYIGMSYMRRFNGFYFGIQHRSVEEAKALLFDRGWSPPRSVPSTIFDESKYHLVDWPISGSHGLELAAEGMRSFVSDIVLPYLRTHEDPEAIRKTILHDPRHGHTAGDWHGSRHVTVFAVDGLLRRRDLLDDDYEHYRQYYRERALEELGPDYETARKNWDAIASSET